jgi:hypothetical protein
MFAVICLPWNLINVWYSHVPRIHLGMKLFGIKCLNLVSKEKISRKYNVDAGLIVKEVLIVHP